MNELLLKFLTGWKQKKISCCILFRSRFKTILQISPLLGPKVVQNHILLKFFEYFSVTEENNFFIAEKYLKNFKSKAACSSIKVHFFNII